MTNKKTFEVILGIMLVFGLVLAGCDNGNTSDNGNDTKNGNGLTALSLEIEDTYKVNILCNGKFTEHISDQDATGFVLMQNGVSQNIERVVAASGRDFFTLYMDNYNLSSGDTIIVSYDGTSGLFLEKVKAFNLTL
jgi:hypothetical protein